jgi:tetratricopeptide (TPR) repeat protein
VWLCGVVVLLRSTTHHTANVSENALATALVENNAYVKGLGLCPLLCMDGYQSHAELELTLRRRSSGGYAVEVRFHHGQSEAEVRYTAQAAFDTVRLDTLAHDTLSYGQCLGQSLFSDPTLREHVAHARSTALAMGVALRLRLFIGDSAPELHALRWETLCHPQDGRLLMTNTNILFSRFLGSQDWHYIQPPSRPDLRALVAIANPSNLSTYHPGNRSLAPIDVAGELARVQASLGQHLPLTCLYSASNSPPTANAHMLPPPDVPGPVTLNTINDHMQDGYHMVYLVAHGALIDGDPWLWLEGNDGRAAVVEGSKLVTRLVELQQRPLLVVLAACQSAESSHAHGDATHATPLALHMTEMGIPSVLGMQGNISMQTVEQFMPIFFRELVEDGQIDRAVAVARGAVRDRHDWWMPVLCMRVRNGKLWNVAGADAGVPHEQQAKAGPEHLLARLPLDIIPAPTTLPSGSRMPYAINPLFVGRKETMQRLARELKGNESRIGNQTVAITGLAGVGKTQLACEFVHRYGAYFAGGVFWLNCADPHGIAGEVVLCGGAEHMNLPGFRSLSLDEQVDRVQKEWLSDTPRLLVFDNCEEQEILQQWRPTTGGCRVVVTSRRAQWDVTLGVTTLSLDVLSRRESIDLLLTFLPDTPCQPSDEQSGGQPDGQPSGQDDVTVASTYPSLDAIAAELGDLPLALHLAGSYMARYRQRLAPADYLNQVRSPALLQHRSMQGRGAAVSPTGHELNIARTFALSFDELDPADVIDALAIQLLARAAWFAPGEPIPREILLSTLDLPDDDMDALLDAEDAIIRLVELGLLEMGTGGALRLHRLLSAFVHQAAEDADAQTAVERAMLTVASKVNAGSDPRPLLTVQPHLRAVADAARNRTDEQAILLCNSLGYHLQMMGDYAGAQPYLERALAIREMVSGADHLDTAQSLNNLGMLLLEKGDYDAAGFHLRWALAIYEQNLGENHRQTATSLSNLGGLLKAQGDYAGAQACYERVLTICEQVTGTDHPDMAAVLNDLGMVHYAQGNYATALPYLERARAIYHQARPTLGENHPYIATTLNNLGTLFEAQERYDEAQQSYEQALVLWEQLFGEHHPDTAASLNNLGLLLYKRGEYDQAQVFLERTLAIYHRVVGEQHPHTASTLTNLGLVHYARGDYASAQPCLERSLAIYRQVVGEQHPLTAQSFHNLAVLWFSQGERDEAAHMMRHALAIRSQILGAHHPDTLLTQQNLDAIGVS